MKIDLNSFKQKYIRPKKGLFPVGSRVYKGYQGSGKTLSMVHYAFEIHEKFPDALIFSNIKITGIDENHFMFIEDDSILKYALTVQRGERGVLVLLDEAHLYFNRKNGISLDVLTCISQQRKDRRRLVFSSQIWEELDLSLRKQVKEIVSCHTIFNKIQINTISDGESLTYDKLSSQYVAKKLYTEIFKHNQELYNSYNTYQKIITNDSYNRIPNSTNNIIIETPRKKPLSFK